MFCGGYLFTRLASLLVNVSYICGMTFESKDREDSQGLVFTEERVLVTKELSGLARYLHAAGPLRVTSSNSAEGRQSLHA